jgi:hypothetical protein
MEMQSRDAHVGKMEQQFQHWGAKLDDLVERIDERVDNVSEDAKVEYRRRVQDLRARHRLAEDKLEQLRTAGAESWQALKAGAEKAWSEFEVAFKSLSQPDRPTRGSKPRANSQ